jgi:hypothetical protein
MNNTHKRPRLVNVLVVPWEKPAGMYGISCVYDDGVRFSEMWGSKEECEVMASARRCEISTDANLKR